MFPPFKSSSLKDRYFANDPSFFSNIILRNLQEKVDELCKKFLSSSPKLGQVCKVNSRFRAMPGVVPALLDCRLLLVVVVYGCP